MFKNPFRNKPSGNIQPNIDDWGKSKFKPRFGGKGTNDRKFNSKESNFHKNKEKYKFNEVSRDAKPSNATPWNKYKYEICYKQKEDEQMALQTNMESSEAKAALKQREINYRKSLIQQKQQEPVEWEDFVEEERIGKYKIKSTNCSKNKSGVQKRKNNNKQSKLKCAKELISKDLLQNFDSKKLNYKQNDKLRNIITKTAFMASSGYNLSVVVREMKKKVIKIDS